MPRMVAVLFAYSDGPYATEPCVDIWCEERDARRYAGPHPVVAHPPCARWSSLANLVEKVHGIRRGNDFGCFRAALNAVRRWGGVLEHPAYSRAWAAYGLREPPRRGWVIADSSGGWTCQVEQSRYGHVSRKRTWLYACGVIRERLRWGITSNADLDRGPWVRTTTTKLSNPKVRDLPRAPGRKASETPDGFRALLLRMARSAT